MSGQQGQTTPHAVPAEGSATDPSMEDILASIRRILNEEDAPKSPDAQEAGIPNSPEHPQHAPPDDLFPHPILPGENHAETGVLDLDPSMMVSDGLPEMSGPVPAPPPVMVEPSASPVMPPPIPAPSMMPVPAAMIDPLMAPVMAPVMTPVMTPVINLSPLSEPIVAHPVPPPSEPADFPLPSHESLVAPAAAAAAASAVGALMRTLANERSTAVHRGGPTIEDLVRDEMRPLLKSWLDEHLAPMVERLVRAEIERVVSRMT